MATAFDVPANKLIPKMADELKKLETVKPPEWAAFVKTGRHKEKSPMQEGWWYIRSAAMLRKIYIEGPIGTTRLAAMYGGCADRGSKPDKAVRGSRSISRHTVQQLEKSQLIQKEKDGGRAVTAKGRKLVDSLATQVLKEMAAQNPELTKYL
ncbi:MAG: small subunit ribosomal protein S19e [Candidatus Thermoplasmatota archaeon]|nr:small subunit ribosomal protein S19e [Candidatus Thermoplasmatota archaeon]